MCQRLLNDYKSVEIIINDCSIGHSMIINNYSMIINGSKW